MRQQTWLLTVQRSIKGLLMDTSLASVTLPAGRTVTTNDVILEGFSSHFQDLFTRESSLTIEQLANFSHRGDQSG